MDDDTCESFDKKETDVRTKGSEDQHTFLMLAADILKKYEHMGDIG